MRFRKSFFLQILTGLALFLSVMLFQKMEDVSAAGSYTNAKEFYESTGTQGYHIEAYSGAIYYATKAKLASGSGNLKYGTVGYDISLSGNGQTVNFSVKRNGNGAMQEVVGSRVESGGYMYNLYSIPAEKLFALAMNTSPVAAAAVFGSSGITVRIDAVMTTSQNGVKHGDVEEDGSGGLIEWGSVYHLKNPSDLAAMRRIFSGHYFTSFYNICLPMDNFVLSIRYKLNGGTVSNGYSSQGDYLYLNGSPVTTRARVLQQVNLVNQLSIKITKTGYHTVAGKEWMYGGRYFDQSAAYMPKDIYPSIGDGDKSITLEANWQANSYIIQYNANGGAGYMGSTSVTYGSTGSLKKNVFTRKGYYFTGWNTRADGTGTAYTDGQSVYNLTDRQGEVITLYARWEPLVFCITTDQQGGTGGTDSIYEKFAVGWFFDSDCLTGTDSVIIPQRRGYNFMSYFQGLYGLGKQITDITGKILISSDYFSADDRIFAYWEPMKFTITFDKQGGVGGTDSVIATYDAELPAAEAPVRTGFSFQGYYTEVNGGGELYYNEFMAPNTRYRLVDDITLYAYWVDDSVPEVTLTTDISIWTNREITLTADAFDYGTGLSSLTVYRGDTKVAEKTGLDGAVRDRLVFINPLEGAVTYKAVAVDMAGNRKEAFRTVYYDITPPDGVITSESYDGMTMSLTVEDVTDINVQ